MKHALALIFCIFNAYFYSQIQDFKHMNEPKAKTQVKQLSKFNDARIDPYYWMNKRESKEVMEIIHAENAYTQSYFDQYSDLTNTFLSEFENRINPNERSSVFYTSNRAFYYQSQEGKEYRTLMEIVAGQETVFFDENERAKNHSFYEFSDWSLSPDGKTLAFSEDLVGRRKYTIFFRNEATGKLSSEKITNCDGSIEWSNDGKYLFYVKKDPKTLREFQVYRHEFGKKQSEDELIFEEKDERFSVYISKTNNDKYIQVNSLSSLTSNTYLIPSDYPLEKPMLFSSQKTGHLYEVESYENGFYVLSNENAPNNKLIYYQNFPNRSSVAEEIIPHDENELIENFLVLKDYILIQKRVKGLQKIDVYHIASKKIRSIEMDEETYMLDFYYNDQFESPRFYYTYTSLTTPASVYSYDLSTGNKELFFQKKLIDTTFSPANYISKRVWARANDGTLIPISLVYKKGIDLSKAPLLLYGYGSYGITIPPSFSATRLSLLDRGFVYAIAHIRGGKYMGESWYTDGKFLKKINTFTDFINCADYLAMQGYCNPDHIYAQGGSAGGLLMGAVANMAPYRWRGIVAQVPFVDVLTTMLDTDIPLTVGEFEEWGNPAEEEYYWYLQNYSPYDNIHKMDYPAMYVTTGYHDSQVQYWEPLKWVSKLRAMRTNAAPLLFDCDLDSGHGGGSGRSKERIEIARVFTFLISLEN